MDFVERAKEALGVKTDSGLAQALGVAPSVVAGYKRRGVVPLEQCIKIAELSGVDLNWLILSKGDSVKPKDNFEQFKYAKGTDCVGVPLYDVTASAGSGCFFDNENVLQHMQFSKEWMANEGLYQKDLVCIFIRGDSMAPALHDTDIVLVNKARTRGDGIFVIRIGDALRIKRLQWLSTGQLQIISDNPAYNMETVDPADISDNFEIIGACHTKIGRVL